MAPYRRSRVCDLLLVTFVAVAIPRFVGAGGDPDPVLEFGFSGLPEQLRGEPGEIVEFQAYLTLQILEGAEQAYIQGWSQSVVVDGAEVVGWNFDDLTIPSDVGEVPVVPAFFYAYGHAENPDNPDERGIAGALLNPAYNHAYAFFPIEPTPVIRILLETEIPADGTDRTVELRYQDGLQGAGQPITNAFTHDGHRVFPELTSTSFIATSRTEDFVRGDTNEDGRHDVSDAVVLLNYLFRDFVETECEDTFDTNDDGVLELTDAVVLFNYLFRGGPRPADPFDECRDDSTDDAMRCWSHSACD